MQPTESSTLCPCSYSDAIGHVVPMWGFGTRTPRFTHSYSITWRSGEREEEEEEEKYEGWKADLKTSLLSTKL